MKIDFHNHFKQVNTSLQTDQFEPWMRSSQVETVRVRVGLGVMAMKGWVNNSQSSRAESSLIGFNLVHTQGTPFERGLFRKSCSRCILGPANMSPISWWDKRETERETERDRDWDTKRKGQTDRHRLTERDWQTERQRNREAPKKQYFMALWSAHFWQKNVPENSPSILSGQGSDLGYWSTRATEAL